MLPFTTAVVLMFRLRDLLFLESMWFPNARRRVSLPVLVSLMRLAVPLWVFIFGITYSLLRCSGCDLPSLVSVRERLRFRVVKRHDRLVRTQAPCVPSLGRDKR